MNHQIGFATSQDTKLNIVVFLDKPVSLVCYFSKANLLLIDKVSDTQYILIKTRVTLCCQMVG